MKNSKLVNLLWTVYNSCALVNVKILLQSTLLVAAQNTPKQLKTQLNTKPSTAPCNYLNDFVQYGSLEEPESLSRLVEQ